MTRLCNNKTYKYKWIICWSSIQTITTITMLLLLSVVLLAATVVAQCPTAPLTVSTPPNCANYPNSYFVNDPSNCQAYWYCANANSQPISGTCECPYNFDQANQLCNHPSNFPCDANPTTTPSPTTTTAGTPTPSPTTTTAGTPSPTTTTAGTPPPIGYVEVAVREHNYYRDIHCVPHVSSFSSDINDFAQTWADYLASTGQFFHSDNSGFGENLYMSMGGSTDKNVIMVNGIKRFYDEIQYYDWNNPVFSMETGHFTQVVWKASIEIGVGIATYPDATYGHRTVVAINYRPPGNYAGRFVENVPRPCSLDSIVKALNYTIPHNEEWSSKIMVL